MPPIQSLNSPTAASPSPLPPANTNPDTLVAGSTQATTAANAAQLTNPAAVSAAPSSPVPSSSQFPGSANTPINPAAATPEVSSPSNNNTSTTAKPRLRIVPHIENARSLHFEVIDREVENNVQIKIGRFTERLASANRITFKSKVVSRTHAELWAVNGQFFIRDTKSSSGTFLNHIRLSPPNQESRPFALKDGDVIQLGVDYQGGTEDIYRCVKMRLEINRTWQNANNPFRLNALRTLRALRKQSGLAKDATADCCICLCTIAPFQALFIAPCSHAFHYKCARQLLMNWPAFTCPLCRTFADLEASVSTDNLAELFGDELDLEDGEIEKVSSSASSSGAGAGGEVPPTLTKTSTTRNSTEGVPLSSSAVDLPALANAEIGGTSNDENQVS